MAFKMKGAPYPKSAFKHDNPNEPFHVHDTPEKKAQRDLDAMAAGSRFHPDGTRKKGEDKKMAKEMRKWTGLDQQKYDRQTRREGKKFTRKYGEGQEGLDKYRDKQQRKRKRKSDWKKSGARKVLTALNPFDAESKKARATRSTARKNKRREGESGRNVGKNCGEGGCGAYGYK